MLPSEDEDGDSESAGLRERCALCRLSRDSLLGQGQLIQCRSPNFLYKKQKSKLGIESARNDNLIEKSILPTNNNKPRWNNHILDYDEGKSELATIGFSEVPRWDELLGEQGFLVVHHCCAAWSDGVLQDDNYQFQNVDKAINVGSKQKCDFCGRYGASICCRAYKCVKFYHYPCAAAAGTLQVFSNMTLLCADHLAQAKPSEVICAVCKTMGDCQDQMFCTICGNHYHSKCLQTSITPSPELRAGWQCPDCKQCQVCGMATNGSKMLVCDLCDKGFHTFCLRPMLPSLPKQSWKCATCRFCEDCGATMSAAISKWHLNYTLCDLCFNQRNKGDFCPVCCKAHDSFIEVAMLTCSMCNRAVHGECETNADSLIPNCRSNYHCPYCRGEVNLSEMIVTEEQRELIKNNICRPSIMDVDCTQSNNSDDNSSGLSTPTPTEISVKSDDSNGILPASNVPKLEPLDVCYPYASSVVIKPPTSLPNDTFTPPLPLVSAGKKKSKGGVAEKNRSKKKSGCSSFSASNKRSLSRSASGSNSCGVVDVVEAMKDDDDDQSNYCNVVIHSSEDTFVCDQDVCFSCGSFGIDTEGKMIACAQCGQAYHIYCTNLNLSKEGLKKVVESGWRCLDCTVCNSCGNANDEARLLLCDDCDISYHTYCLEPPLDTVPIGGWKCKWCVHCVKCSSNTPGVNCNWLSNYTECGPCHSSATCPVCLQGYTEEDLLANCETCTRWLHAKCDNISGEAELDWVVSRSYQCVLCRPKLKPSTASSALSLTDNPDRGDQVQDGVSLTESGAHHIKSINCFTNTSSAAASLASQLKRRPSTRATRPVRIKSQRSLNDKPDLLLDDSEDDFLSDTDPTVIMNTETGKRKPKSKSNTGKHFSKPGKPGKVSKSKNSFESRNEPQTYESLMSCAIADEQAQICAAAEEAFFGNALIEMANKAEKGIPCNIGNENYPSSVSDDRKVEKTTNEDLILPEDELNLPVDDFLYDIFMNNDQDHDQFSAFTEDINVISQGLSQNASTVDTNQNLEQNSSIVNHLSQPDSSCQRDISGQSELNQVSGKDANLTVPSVSSKTAQQPQKTMMQISPVACLSNGSNGSIVIQQQTSTVAVAALNAQEVGKVMEKQTGRAVGIDSATQFAVFANQSVPNEHHSQQDAHNASNAHRNVLDVDGLLSCTGGTGFMSVVDSLPQFDSQDVDEILDDTNACGDDSNSHSMMQQAMPVAAPQFHQQIMNPQMAPGMRMQVAFAPGAPTAWQTNAPVHGNQLPVVKMMPPESMHAVVGPAATKSMSNALDSSGSSSVANQDSMDAEDGKNCKRYEADEVLGDNARIAAVLYANKKHPNLKIEFPNTAARMKQIHKLWRKASPSDKAEITQMAKDNRANSRSGGKKGKKSPSAVANKDAGSKGAQMGGKAGPSSHNQAGMEHVEMVQQMAHHQQFIEQHIASASYAPPPSVGTPNTQMMPEDSGRPMQNFTPSKNSMAFSPVAAGGVSVDQQQSVSSDSESSKHRLSVHSTGDPFGSSPMPIDMNQQQQQHSPALSQSSIPKNSPLVQSPQRPLSFTPNNSSVSSAIDAAATPINVQGSSSVSPVAVNALPAQATSTHNPVSPHAAMYRQQPMQMQQMRHQSAPPSHVQGPPPPQYYAPPQSSGAYVMTPPGASGAPAFYYQGAPGPQMHRYRAAGWASHGEMMAQAQWGPPHSQMHHYSAAAPRKFMVRQPPPGMFPHYRSLPPQGYVTAQSHPQMAGGHWSLSARAAPAGPAHYGEMFGSPSGQAPGMRVQPHYGATAQPTAVSYQRSTSVMHQGPISAPAAPTGNMRSPSAQNPQSAPMASPIDKQTMGMNMQSQNVMENSSQQKGKLSTSSMPVVLSEAETFEFDFYQPPSVQNETGNDRSATDDRPPSSSSGSRRGNSSHQDYHHAFDGIDFTPSLDTHNQESRGDSLDVDQLDATFLEAVKDRPPGSSGPLTMAGKTLNEAATLAVFDVVDQLSANYKVTSSASSVSDSQNVSRGMHVQSTSVSKMSQSDEMMMSASYQQQQMRDQVKSKLVSEQRLLIEDLLEQEKKEQKWNSAAALHSPVSKGGKASPSFPHSEMLQRMATVSNRGVPNPPPGSVALTSPSQMFAHQMQPPLSMVHVYGGNAPQVANQRYPPTPMQLMGGHQPQHQKHEHLGPSRFHSNPGLLLHSPQQASPSQGSPSAADHMPMLLGRQMSESAVSAELYQGDILGSRQKKAEGELEKLRRSKKALLSKQRNAKKSGGDLTEIERKNVEKLTNDISEKVKEVENIRKKIKSVVNDSGPLADLDIHLKASSIMGPPHHPTIVPPTKGINPASIQLSSPRLKRASQSVDSSSQLGSLMVKNELSHRSAHPDSFSLTSNDNSNQSCLDPELALMASAGPDIQSSSLLEPSSKRRKMKQPSTTDDSSHMTAMMVNTSGSLMTHHQQQLTSGDHAQFPEAFLDAGTSNNDDTMAAQDALLNAIKQLPELKPQEPDLKIEWTLISPKVPWPSEMTNGVSMLTGHFGKASIPGSKDYYTAFLNGEQLPGSESPSPSPATSESKDVTLSPRSKTAGNVEKKDKRDIDLSLGNEGDPRYRVDSGTSGSGLSIDDEDSVFSSDQNSNKMQLTYLRELDVAAKRASGAVSPILQSDWFSDHVIAKPETEAMDAEKREKSRGRFSKAERRLNEDEKLHGKATMDDDHMEISLEVRNSGSSQIHELQGLLKRLSQMLCIDPLDESNVNSKENRMPSECLELQFGSADSLQGQTSQLLLNVKDSKLLCKRSPNVMFNSKVCTTCRSVLGSGSVTKNLNEILHGHSEQLQFCSNDCFLQMAILMKKNAANRQCSKSLMKRFDGFSQFDMNELESKLRSSGSSQDNTCSGNVLRNARRWENIRWRRFKRPSPRPSLSQTPVAPTAALSNAELNPEFSYFPNSELPALNSSAESDKENSPKAVIHPQNIGLKEEIVKMMNDINVCVTFDRSSDARRCLFCLEVGDGKPNGPGRLLNYDIDRWVHLNCALWSEEVYETTNGALINVQAAYLRGSEQECSRCGHFGATVACHKTKCPFEYHFPCALLVGCMFFVDKTVLCPQHKYRTKPDTELDRFEALRRVYINRDEHEMIAKVVEQPETKFTFRCGATQLINIGQLFPHQMNAFHATNAIYPVGFRTSRFYWSLDDINSRCKYTCQIEDVDGRPQFVVSTADKKDKKSQQNKESFESDDKEKEKSESSEFCEKGKMRVFKGPNPKDPWKEIMTNVNKLRLANSNSLKLFSEVCSGEDMFGLSDVQIVKILESFPSIEACKKYNFKFGRSPLVHLPLAINPSGCCRSEPKMRSYIKRPHVLTSSPKGKSSRSSIPSLVCGSSESAWGESVSSGSAPYSKQFVHTKSSQYKRMKQEWRKLCHLSRSSIQGLGMYSSKDIDKGTMIIEYIGLLIRSEVAEVREKQYDRMNRGIYMFRLDDDWVIDATIHGGPARFINHSCEPNCQAELVVFDKGTSGNSTGPGGVPLTSMGGCAVDSRKEKRIIITSIRRIAHGEELTYDYKIDFENDEDKIPCNCGSSICRKWMN